MAGGLLDRAQPGGLVMEEKMLVEAEGKSPTETLDLQTRMQETWAGTRPVNEPSYPHFAPEYKIPFLHIGQEKQLFLDNFILDHLDDVVRQVQTPQRSGEPILEVGDLPWEGHHNPIPSGLVHDPDDGKFKLWYVQSLTGDPFNTGQVLCYAESTDCLHWQKPLSKRCLPYQGHVATNIVQQDTNAVTVVLNHDRSDPERKFLMLYCPSAQAKGRGQRTNSSVAISPDGLQWRVISDDSSFRHHHEVRILWDAEIQKWVAFSQYSHHWNFLHRKRQIGRQESSDFIHWSPKEVVLSVDWDGNLPPNLEFHEMSARKVGSLYIGITGEFMGEPLWQVRNGHNWRDHAHVRLGLYNSRDGKRWQRAIGPEAWVENGPSGSMDYGYVCYTPSGMMEHAGKTYIPYMAGPEKQSWFWTTPPTPVVPEEDFARGKAAWERVGAAMPEGRTNKRSVGALLLREDGWAAMRPHTEHGQVITRQFVFEGDALRINAESSGGYVQVEVLDPYFKPYPGFSSAECLPIHGAKPSQVWHEVVWRDTSGERSDLRQLWNQPCRLRIELHQATLYAFQFTSS